MSYVNLEGTSEGGNAFPKVLLPRESTIGTVKEVSSWAGTKKIKNADGGFTEKQSEKIIITVETSDGKVLSCFQNAQVKKGSKPSYDTLSYTNATNLGLLDKFKNEKEKIKSLEDMVTFWSSALKGKKIKFVPETIVPESGERYSAIKIIDNWA